MRRIQFIKNLGKREGQGAGPEYKQGEVHEFTGPVAEGYAQAYIDRGYAVDHEEAAPKPKPEPAKDADKEPAKDAGKDHPAKSEAHPMASPAIGSQKPPQQPAPKR